MLIHLRPAFTTRLSRKFKIIDVKTQFSTLPKDCILIPITVCYSKFQQKRPNFLGDYRNAIFALL